MKKTVTIHATILWFASATVLALSISASAQSGRVVPTPTPTPQTTPPDQLDTKPKFVVDSSADSYKLVFPTSCDGALYKGRLYCPSGPSLYNSFIEHLNNAAAQGYRLMSATKFSGVVAIVKLDKVQYEYAWFETGSDLWWVTSGFEGSYSQLSKHGLRVVDHCLISYSCSSRDPDNALAGDTCDIEDFFLLEREKGAEQPTQHRIVGSAPRWHNRSPELTAQVNEKIAKGFYPSMMPSKFEVLLEQGKKDEPLAGKQDVRVVTSAQWHDDMKKRVNELANQGYRMALTYREIAVMYRDSDTTSPVSYIWLEANKKDFEKQLATLQAQGAVYRMTYPSGNGIEDQLVFEQSAVNDGKRREYKVLRLEFQKTEDAAAEKIYTDLSPASKETINLINRLVNEGFAVRDLFTTDTLSVLLERSR